MHKKTLICKFCNKETVIAPWTAKKAQSIFYCQNNSCTVKPRLH